MEKHEEILLEQLEAVGKEIAKCRNELTEMINSGSRTVTISSQKKTIKNT